MISLKTKGVSDFHNANMQRFSEVNKKTPENIESVKKLASEFEAIFLEIVLKSMRDSVQKSDLMKGGNGEDIFQSMLDSEYAKSLSAQASTGLASSMQEQLLSMMVGEEPAVQAVRASGIEKYINAPLPR